jgi:hypothetical protein
MIATVSGPNRDPDESVIDLVCRMDGFSLHAELIRARFAARDE